MEETTLLLNKPTSSSSSSLFKYFRNSKGPCKDYASMNVEREYSQQDEMVINQMLNALLIRIECPENVTTSERLSRIVFSNTKEGSNNAHNNSWIIHAYLPAIYSRNDLCSDIKIVLKRKEKVKCVLMDLKHTLMDNSDNQQGYICFRTSYLNMYKTGTDPCWVTATCGNVARTKVQLNTFERSIPSSIRSCPSCWDVLFEISHIIHQNIEKEDREERFELAKLLNYWATIIAVQNNESKKNKNNFFMMDGEFPKSITKLDELRNSPMFLLMFLLFNCENHPEYNIGQSGMDRSRELQQVLGGIDLQLQGHEEKQPRANSLVSLMERASLLLRLKDVIEKKSFLSSELGGQFSHLLCLANSSNQKLILSLHFKLQYDLHSSDCPNKEDDEHQCDFESFCEVGGDTHMICALTTLILDGPLKNHPMQDFLVKSLRQTRVVYFLEQELYHHDEIFPCNSTPYSVAVHNKKQLLLATFSKYMIVFDLESQLPKYRLNFPFITRQAIKSSDGSQSNRWNINTSSWTSMCLDDADNLKIITTCESLIIYFAPDFSRNRVVSIETDIFGKFRHLNLHGDCSYGTIMNDTGDLLVVDKRYCNIITSTYNPTLHSDSSSGIMYEYHLDSFHRVEFRMKRHIVHAPLDPNLVEIIKSNFGILPQSNSASEIAHSSISLREWNYQPEN
ncbi:predicted protein [Naegleria gruberi]|uniref:Predicted protein n=1 Tax=Naegleria gruberi TaxID=5762 RepID=D2V879_NAEGR|nr:uncharacterized protein NAEGRDRAFT_47452 [Naegleria gruberi]EFC47131.1 predicted protein [Naegleria gruberi]|eukprot:XP_002679875.1 predicted protein [Naegleria gruberi strain NEG-M]